MRTWLASVERLAAPLLFLALFVLIVLSNQHDWDQALSFAEVDRRAWLLDHAAPRWSYQLCAGASRVGDPLAFGLSPLFLSVLTLGSFWGTKYLVLGCMLAGWLGLRRGLQLVFPQLDARLANALSAFFLFGDYLLWHLHAGQPTFALIALSLPGLALLAKLFRAPFTRRDAIWLALLIAALMSAGFHALVAYWWVPGLLCLAVPALALRLGPFPERRSLGRFAIGLAVGLAVSAPKWVAVLVYQWQHRALDGDHHAPDRAATLQSLWEYTALSAVSVLAFVLLRGARTQTPHDRRTLAFFLVASLSTAGLSFHDSDCAITHQLVLLLFASWRLAGDAALRARAKTWLIPAGYAICACNLALLLARTDRKSTREAMHVERRTSSTMQIERFTPTSSTYAVIARGEIVPNCNQPLPRPRAIATEGRAFGVEIHDDDTIDLADPDPGPVSAPCRASVAVTQQQILFDVAACPSDLCLNLNAIDPSADQPFALDEERGKYCRRR